MAEDNTAKRLTKAQIISQLAERVHLEKKSVTAVLDALCELASEELGGKGSGEFTIPGLVRMKTVEKPATQDRPGVNPFTKQPMVIKGKPASKKVRVTVVKGLKDKVQ